MPPHTNTPQKTQHSTKTAARRNMSIFLDITHTGTLQSSYTLLDNTKKATQARRIFS